MKVIILGAAGFIGTNLAIALSNIANIELTLVDSKAEYFNPLAKKRIKTVKLLESGFDMKTDFDALLQGQEVLYHLASTNIPSTSNKKIPDELEANVIVTAKLLEACVRNNIKKVVFISSGGTVYGKEVNCPLKEDTPTYPISSYGIQKITIEKLLYLYNYMYGLDYRVIRLSNPYGPYQRPNGVLGVVSTFTYRALKEEEIIVYGDGSVVRDFIYIDDAIKGILKISNGESKHKTFNLGCGYGTSILTLIKTIENVLQVSLNVSFQEARRVDVPVNYLDIGRFEHIYGKLNPVELSIGVLLTANFMKKWLI